MASPIILIVDDDIQVCNAVERDLRQHYRQDYRIMKATSGAVALEVVQRLKQRNDQIALFLVDQRMPGMEGVEFLAEAMKFYPAARKVLLTAYADTQAAIAAINLIGLDHYLMKPWSPPEQNLYPVLDDLLSDWLATAEMPFDGIRVAGTLWSARSHTIKDFLARSQIPYQWLDIEQDAEARALVEAVNKEQHRLPVLFFPDGSTLIDPHITTVAEKVGLRTQATQPFYDLIIVGAGPAGLAAAVYGASEGLCTLLIDKETTGGQAGTSSRIENYLGFPNGLSGADLARRATAQATRLGAEILTAREVTQIRVDDPYRFVKLADGTELSCKALIIATGVSLRTLDILGIEALTGAGVYYGAALTEAAHYKGKPVFVVGGANSAGQGAMFFSRYASKVTMLVRGSSLQNGMSQYLIDQINGTENIEVRVRTSVIEAIGTDRLEAVVIKDNDTGDIETAPAAALFVFIGAKPHSEFVADVVERNEAGFILTGPDLIRDGRRPKNWRLNRDPFLLETSVPGIFAVGDIRQDTIRRVASAVGQGSTAISFVHQYLKTV
ncbi:MAG: fused response regulator/thioredoxin-disulfide reductase [Chloroflexota bacterium]|nr:MAG: fused response regulator/thioredoxin-disulfide reductase [Chloroflexota bacterium]